MDALATARYGLLAAERRFEASAVRIAGAGQDDAVDVASELVESIEAKHAFSANLSVVRFAQDLWKSLLDLHSR